MYQSACSTRLTPVLGIAGLDATSGPVALVFNRRDGTGARAEPGARMQKSAPFGAHFSVLVLTSQASRVPRRGARVVYSEYVLSQGSKGA